VSTPHESWAEHYDLALERTFGGRYRDFTALTLSLIHEHVRPPARVVDFGAGTGRLTVPLALDGYEVTAVDPSPGMLAGLAHRMAVESEEPAPGSRRASSPARPSPSPMASTASGISKLEVVACAMQDYRTDRPHDLALCVFSVVSYLLDRRALWTAARAAARALRVGGLLLVDIPRREVFEGFDVESDDLLRHVEIEPRGGSLFLYREQGAVRGRGAIARQYEDVFELRCWAPAELRAAFEDAGFRVREDFSDLFVEWGAGYLLMER
jgi:SAM-dependent methyltransferase